MNKYLSKSLKTKTSKWADLEGFGECVENASNDLGINTQ